jgi:hypothetical protein
MRRVWLYGRFLREFQQFRRSNSAGNQRFSVSWHDRFPCLGEASAAHGFDRHYVYHPAWATRILAKTKPDYHVDISSTLAFSTALSAFIPTHYYEYRNLDLKLSGLQCGHADLLALSFPSQSVQSLSCMHVVEHIGLGRYGDPLDPDGDLKAMAELERVLAVGGSLLFVVPVGRPRIMFNAQRIYAYGQVRKTFSGLHLQEFSLIPDDPAEGGIITNAPEEMADRQSYGCGCFWFIKNPPPAADQLG